MLSRACLLGVDDLDSIVGSSIDKLALVKGRAIPGVVDLGSNPEVDGGAGKCSTTSSSWSGKESWQNGGGELRCQ